MTRFNLAGLMPVLILDQYPAFINHFISSKASTITYSTNSMFVKISTMPKILATAFVWWAATHSGIVSHLHDRTV